MKQLMLQLGNNLMEILINLYKEILYLIKNKEG